MTPQAEESDHEGGAPSPAPPYRIRVPVNVHDWDSISFLHWLVDPRVVAGLLPEGLTVLTHGGKAAVGVTPFFIRVRPPGLPVTPPGWAFPETNVRTYVTGRDGRQGLWFLHMEVTALWFVATLRALGLPYVRRRMSVAVGDDRVVYAAGGPSSLRGHRIVVRPGGQLDPPEGGPFERFLTARWGAYHRQGPLLWHTPVEHPPWRLRTAEVPTCEVGALFRAAGLPAPQGAPIAHFCPGVTVKVGLPRLVP